MDFVKAQYDRIRQQLGELSASQRMLTVTLLAVMAVTLVYWVRYAGKPEMVALLDQPMGAEDVTRLRGKLGGMGIRYEVTGDRLMVPSEQRDAALGALAFDQALPTSTSTGFDALIKNISPFGGETQNAQWWGQAKQAKLAEMMRGWPGVLDANVIIDSTERRTFTNPVQPKATINIKTRDGRRPEKKLVMAAADLVAGAQSGLDRGRVTVIVNGVSFPMHDQGADSVAAGGGELIELRQQYEEYFTRKINNQLRWLNAEVFVSVTVDVNNRSTQAVETKYDPKGTAKVETRQRTRTSEDQTSQRAGGEPGAGANIQGSIADADTGGDEVSSNTNEDETEYQSGLSRVETTSREGPGGATVRAATVRVPHSYFVRMYRERNPGGGGAGTTEPNEAALQPLLERELGKIRAEVKGCVGLSDDALATVETYADAVLASAEAAPVAPASNVAAVVGVHGKEIALGALAVVSLFMVSMMVRKGSPAPVAAPAEAPGPVPQLAAGEEVVGEAGDGEQMLDGMELDEDAAKTQQMLGQVSDLVKENPDAAANLIKRWLNK